MNKIHWIIRYSYKTNPTMLHETVKIFSFEEAVGHFKNLNNKVAFPDISNASLIRCEYVEENEMILL